MHTCGKLSPADSGYRNLAVGAENHQFLSVAAASSNMFHTLLDNSTHASVSTAGLLYRCYPAAAEEDQFLHLLDSRELAASADESLLVHLLLRADSINRKTIDWRRVKVGAAIATTSQLACIAPSACAR